MVVMVMMIVAMTVVMVVIVMMDALVRPSALRHLAEHQRLDGYWYGVGRHADAAEVDVVEVAQHHAIDRQDLALDQELLAQDRAQGLRDVAVEHDVDRFPPLDRVGEPVPDPLRKGGDTLVGWCALPAQCQRDLALAFDQVERCEVLRSEERRVGKEWRSRWSR